MKMQQINKAISVAQSKTVRSTSSVSFKSTEKIKQQVDEDNFVLVNVEQVSNKNFIFLNKLFNTTVFLVLKSQKLSIQGKNTSSKYFLQNYKSSSLLNGRTSSGKMFCLHNM